MYIDNAVIGREALDKKRTSRPLQTPGDVLHFWFDEAASEPAKLPERNKLWWSGSEEVDRLVASRSVSLLARLASGLGEIWSDKGPAERLAAIVALDQFTRNIFRDTEFAFENDELALTLCKSGLEKNDDKVLAPIKRWFFYLPLMHSENIEDQELCVKLFANLKDEADDATKDVLANAHDFAVKHRDVIEQYGRFPHRNKALGRISTQAEEDYLAQPGAGF